jgi:hypothetical protein
MPNGWARVLWHDDILEPVIGVVKNLCLRLPIEMLWSCGICKIEFGHGTDVLVLGPGEDSAWRLPVCKTDKILCPVGVGS